MTIIAPNTPYTLIAAVWQHNVPAGIYATSAAAEILDDVALGDWQAGWRSILPSLADLAGSAAGYGAHYRRSLTNLVCRAEAHGATLHEVIGRHGRRIWIFVCDGEAPVTALPAS